MHIFSVRIVRVSAETNSSRSRRFIIDKTALIFSEIYEKKNSEIVLPLPKTQKLYCLKNSVFREWLILFAYREKYASYIIFRLSFLLKIHLYLMLRHSESWLFLRPLRNEIQRMNFTTKSLRHTYLLFTRCNWESRYVTGNITRETCSLDLWLFEIEPE